MAAAVGLSKPGAESPPEGEGSPLWQVRESLGELLRDRRIPAEVRAELDADFRSIEALLERLENGRLEIVVLGRVSVGKSSLLNALLGREAFPVSVLHGETKMVDRENLMTARDGAVTLCDTPGIDEFEGEAREAMAHRAAALADLLLFVVEGDPTRSEWQALKAAAGHNRPLLLAVNKADRYSRAEKETLSRHLQKKCADFIPAGNIVLCSAHPAERQVLQVLEDGSERELTEQPEPDISQLADRLWEVVENQGDWLVALNAGLFASQVSDQVAQRITLLRRDIARQLIDRYALGKGVAVAVNPVPAADLAAAAALDAGLILHLSRIYALPVTRREAWRLLAVILGQLATLMGSLWSVNLFASALKLGSGGLSTALTGSAQGAVGYASTWILGRVAEDYFRNGRSWGPAGPKRAVEAVLAEINQNELLAQARADIQRRLRNRKRPAES